MLKNVTMGQYYPVDSAVHRLDPRMKLILTILFIVAVFMSHSFAGYLLLLGFLFFVCRMSNVPFRFMLKGLRPLRMIIILTFLLNLFFTPGENLWISVWVIRIYREGFMQAVFYSLRLAFLVAGTSLLTLTTSPIALSDGIEKLLSPLKVIRFPAHELAMMMTIALRFIPTLLGLCAQRPWSPCWFRCLSVLSGVPAIWPWPWRAAVIMAVKAVHACGF